MSGRASGEDTSADRRRRLLGVKLRALVSEHLGTTVDVEPVGFGAGTALVIDRTAWVLIDGAGARRLGAALSWALRHEATSLHVVADTDGGTIARRGAGFDFPISVWYPEDRVLLPVVADAPFAPAAPTDEHLALVPMIEAAGATPHVEHGVVTGEVRGLEVCRVVDEPTTGNFVELGDVDAQPRPVERTSSGVLLEVGVGANDREAFQLIHGHIPTVQALAGVVDAVTSHRCVEAMQHPLNRMAPERFLRWQVEQDPSRLGLASLTPLDPPVRRQSMKHAEPCVATGADAAGDDVTVVFSSGVDLDLVPFVADVTEVAGSAGTGRLIAALPERDLVPITQDMAARLRRPVEFVALETD